MKKYFSLVAGFILLVFAACQSDELANGGRNGEVAASFSVQLPDDGSTVATRTAGDGATVNRCIMEIYLNGELYNREISAIKAEDKTAKFEVRLVTSQTYNFVFWADHVVPTEDGDINTDLHYKTSDLRNISMQGDYYGSSKDDTRDAFFANLEKLVTNAFSESVSLTRPFGQLNIKTTDLNTIPANHESTLTPATAMLSFKNLYTGFNAATGELLGETEEVAYQNAANVVDADGNLTIDYLFAKKVATEQHLVNMTLAVNDADGKPITTKDLNNIPVQRNYQTNVTGDLLTAAGTVKVTVNPNFTTPALSESVVEVNSVSEVADALKSNTNVVVTTPPTADATISLPKYKEADVAVSITLPATEKDITINYLSESGGEGTNAPKALNITAPSTSKITINAPQTTVTLNGETYTTVEATTAENTLIVESGVTIGTLTLKKGNVKLYGKITNPVTKDTGWTGTITRCLDNQQSYDNLIADNVSGYTSILIEREATFDAAKNGASATVGKPMKIAANATISNLKIHVAETTNVSPIEIVDGAANVTFDNLTASSDNAADLVRVLGTGQKVTIRNSSLLLTSGKSNQSGFDIENSGKNNVITALLEGTYIGFGEKLNVDRKDYTYTEDKASAFTGSNGSRAITSRFNAVKSGDYDGTGITNLTVTNCVFEGVFYVINALHNISLNVNVDNSILDGRAAFNIYSTSQVGSIFNIKNSKLIGRNCFTGPTEDFATIVLYDKNTSDGAAVKYVRNNTITLDNCDVVSDNDPQVETNYQYGVSLRSRYYNKLILKNNTKFREIKNPRLPHAVDIQTNAWRNEVVTDGSVDLTECAAGATVLPSNQWNGYSYAYAGTVADDGKIYIGDPDVLAAFIQDGGNGNGVEVVLVRDLDMGSHKLELRGVNSEAISNCIFNGNNHTISNYKMENAMYAGLFPNAITVTVKNLTLKNANITALNDGSNNAYAGGFIGRAYGTNVVENCTLENSTIQGINKVGGIAGFQAENGISIRNCTVKGSTIKVDTENQEYGQCGGILGYIGAVAGASEVSGNFIINTKVEAPANTNAGEEHRKSSICVGILQGVSGQSLVINMPFSYIQESTFNGKAIDKTDYQGLLGGIRFTAPNPSVTINGTKY